MSQSSTVAGDGQSSQTPTKAPTGRAVFLLAIFVILGIALLHELDSPSSAATTNKTSAAASTSNSTSNQASTQNNAATQQNTSTTLAVRAPSDIKLLVANGVGVQGVAAKVASRL